MKTIYLDHAATCPCDPSVVEVMRPYFTEQFGNALSPHAAGRRARKAIEGAREEIALLLHAKPQEIIFTSSATEANNTAIFSAARSLFSKGRHVIVSAIEHHSVLEPMKRLVAQGFEVSFIPVTKDGIVEPAAVAALIRPDTILAVVAHANNEIGVIQPMVEIGNLLRDRGVCFFVDAVQTAGHIPVDAGAFMADMLSLSAHKFYGPQGVGALFLRQGTPFESLILGGDQERSRRAGTQNTAGIVGMGHAARIARTQMAEEAGIQALMRDDLINFVRNNIPGTVINGHLKHRLPHNAHFSWNGISGEELIAALDLSGICCSMGSACSSGSLTPSHVLKAIGLSDALALGSLRVTLGRGTMPEDLEYFKQQLKIKTAQLCSSR